MKESLDGFASKVKIFIVLFTSSTILTFLLRDHLSTWPSIISTNVVMSAVLALLNDKIKKWGTVVMVRIFRSFPKDKQSG